MDLIRCFPIWKRTSPLIVVLLHVAGARPESPAPATIAVSACGRRDFQMMFSHISLDSPPTRMRQTSAIGMRTDPKSRLTIASATMAISRMIIRGQVRRISLIFQ